MLQKKRISAQQISKVVGCGLGFGLLFFLLTTEYSNLNSWQIQNLLFILVVDKEGNLRKGIGA